MGRLAATPLAFYQAIPLLSGYVAARRWLTLMMALVGAAAFFIVEGLRRSGMVGLEIGYGDWRYYAVGAVFAGVWVFMALAMVGVETAGATLTARFRGWPVDLGAAAKVTSYEIGRAHV